MKTPREGITRHEIVRRLRTGLLVFAVALQGYVSQAHFHNLPSSVSADGVVDVSLATNAAPPRDVPPGDLPANLPDQRNDNCPLCQLIGLGSVSVLPPILVLQPSAPTVLVFTDHGDNPVVAVRGSDHAPRGPPASSVQA